MRVLVPVVFIIHSLCVKKANFAFERLSEILMDNPGLVQLREIANILAGNDGDSVEAVDKYGPGKLVLFKYAPLTSCDVERSFSMFKYIHIEIIENGLLLKIHANTFLLTVIKVYCTLSKSLYIPK